MRRPYAVPCLALAALLFASASHAQQRSAPTLDTEASAEARAAAYAERAERPVYYRVEPETGRLVMNEAGRAAAEAFRASRRPTVTVAPRPRTADPAPSARAPQAPVYRNGELILTLDNAYDDTISIDENPGDGLCAGQFGVCGLRTAIEEANAQPDNQPVRIEFNITFGPPGSEIAPGVWRIRVDEPEGLGPLPVINQPNVRVDALTQPGASCGDLVAGNTHDLRVVLDGSGLAFGEGIFGQGGGLTVRGLVVQNFPSFGIEARSDGDNLVECNYVGTDFTGETAAGNFSGVYIDGTAQNNVVSGNADIGVIGEIFASAPDATTIQFNLVGSDDDGNQALGNGGRGIHVSGDDAVVHTNLASDNFVGIFLGVDPGLHGAFPERATLTNNTVGLNRVRTAALGNFLDGIVLAESSSPDGAPSDNDIGLPGAGLGNFVSGNSAFGMALFGSSTTNNRIRGNTVGLTRLGDALPNGSYGVLVSGAVATQIGGLGAGEGNVISGNGESGISLGGDIGTHIEGNTIGLNASGAIRPNGQVGDGLFNSGIETISNFDAVIRGNTISGNNGSGIRIFGFANRASGDDVLAAKPSVGERSVGFLIADNRVGTNAAGTAARPNVESGLVLTDGANFASVTGNTISGNTDTGVFLTENVTGVVIEDNFIGTNASGANLGNGLPGGDGRAGVFCQDASNVRVGQGRGVGQTLLPNTIRFNGTDGVFVGASCQDISVVGNTISNNGGLAVDLAPNGPNPNDAGDGDTGANDKLNFPIITSAENNGSNTNVTFVLDAEPFVTYELGFCRADTPDPSGFGECPTPLGLTIITTNGLGAANGSISFGAGAVPAGSFVTANMSPFIGPNYIKTSEFSASVEVEDTSTPGEVTIDATPTSPLTVPRGGQVSFNYTVDNGTDNPATGQSWFSAALQNGPTLAEGVITNGTLPAGQSVNIDYVQNVPNNAPIASYDFCLRIGLFPNTVIDEACFVVTVTPAPPVAGGSEDWSVEDVSDWAPEPMGIAAGAEAEGVAAASSGALPETAELAGAYPNPFSRQATVAFAVPETGRVTVSVYDVLGREVARLVDGDLGAGRHEAVLDGSALPSGVYLVRLATGDTVQTQRVTLLR